MKSRFSRIVSQPIGVLAALVLFALSPLAFAADDKGKSSSSSSCSTQMITEMKSALSECMPQKSGSGGSEKGGSKGGKSGNLLDAERGLDIEPRLAYLQQSGGGSGGSSDQGSKGSDGASAKGGSKGGNDTSPLACTLTKIKGKSKIIDDVMTQCQSASSNSSSDSKGSKSQSSGSSQAQKDKQHGGGAKEGGSGGSGGNSAGATSPVDTCILQKFQDVCPEFQADPTVAAAFPSQSSSSDDKKHSKN